MNFSYRTALALIGTGALLGSLAPASGGPHLQAPPPANAPIANSTDISVLTYNINGLPWPLAHGRGEAFSRMEDRLNAMRVTGSQPHIVVLQEAFTDRARAIGANSGYRYVVDGPSSSQSGDVPDLKPDKGFTTASSFINGEGIGKWLGSGLQILSDYRLLSVRRTAFPPFACAGYDCLANKGALLITVRVPGRSEPVTIVTTHMNSKHASGVSEARSAEAYRMQAETLRQFVQKNHDSASPIIIGGDFNASNLERRRILAVETVVPLSSGARRRMRSALAEAAAGVRSWPQRLKSEVNTIEQRGRDWQFVASGAHAALAPVAISVPFGVESDGRMLSDHMGVMISYRLEPQG